GDNVEQQQHFSSATIAIRAQKKILSKVISRNNVKLFVDDATIRLFDHLYQILKTTYNKMVAEKVVKNIIKLVVKLGVVLRNEQLSIEQQNQLTKIQRQMRQLCLTVISFGKVAFSYDFAYLNALLNETYRRLLPLIEQILSGKSKQRLDMIFEHLCKDSVLDSLFRTDGQHWKLLPNVVMDLEVLIDRKEL
uniref:TFIP8 n=1 Tax=Elaeophora elaphi TaxID=1147741 RepID=A0A0R3RPG0_9BILA